MIPPIKKMKFVYEAFKQLALFNLYYFFIAFLLFLTSCGSSGITGRWVREGQGFMVDEYNDGGEYIRYKYDGLKKDLIEERKGFWEVKDDSLYVTDKDQKQMMFTSKIKIESGTMESTFKNNKNEIVSLKYLSYSGLDQLKDMRKGDKYEAKNFVEYKVGACWGSVLSVEEAGENTYKVIFERTTNSAKFSEYFGCECCYEPPTKTVMVYYNPETNAYKADL